MLFGGVKIMRKDITTNTYIAIHYRSLDTTCYLDTTELISVCKELLRSDLHRHCVYLSMYYVIQGVRDGYFDIVIHVTWSYEVLSSFSQA